MNEKTMDLEMNNQKRLARYARYGGFSIKALLAVVTLLGVVLGGVVYWYQMTNPIKEQWLAAEMIIAAGAEIETAPSGLPAWMLSSLPADQREVILGVTLEEKRLAVDEVRSISKLKWLRRLKLNRCSLKDEHCRDFGELKSLRQVWLNGNPNLTDEGVATLLQLKELEDVQLDGTEVSWRTALQFRDLSAKDLKIVATGSQSNPGRRPPSNQILLAQFKADEFPWLMKQGTIQKITLDGDPGFSEQELGQLLNKQDLNFVEATCQIPRDRDFMRQIIEGSAVGVETILVRQINDRTAITFQRRAKNLYDPATGANAAKRPQVVIAMEVAEPALDVFEGLESLQSARYAQFIGRPNATSVSLLRSTPNVIGLSLQGVAKMEDAGWAPIQELAKLESLDIRGDDTDLDLPDDWFEKFNSRESLRTITLVDSGIGKAQLNPLYQFPNLKNMSLGQPLVATREPVDDRQDWRLRAKRKQHDSKATAWPDGKSETDDGG